MEIVRVKPNKNERTKKPLRVKNPQTGAIINGEINLPKTKELQRLIRFGDLVVVEKKSRKPAKETNNEENK